MLLCLVVIFLFLAVLTLIISLTIRDIIGNAHSYVQEFEALFDHIIKFAEKFGYTEDQIKGMMPHINVGEYALAVLETLVDLIPQMVLVLLIVVYMLLDSSEDPTAKKSKLSETINHQIRSYIMVTIAMRIYGFLLLNVYVQPSS